jgi:Lipocalin-like domain
VFLGPDEPAVRCPYREVMRTDDILGAWELHSYTARDTADDMVTHPFGENPVGLLLYTPDGFMSAQLMRSGRPHFDRPRTDGGTSEQTVAAAQGYLAYSGRFIVDEDTDTVHHEIMVSLLPNWVNQTQLRAAGLADGYLTLRADTTSRGGVTTTHILVWRRAG